MSNLACRKLLTAYNDGTFAWAAEGSFFKEEFNNGNKTLQKIGKEFYYSNGENYNHFLSVMQTIWITVLFFSIFAIFYKRKTDILVIMLAILGLTLFEIIFEVRARYLFRYVPLYIILACVGIYQINNFLKKVKTKRKIRRTGRFK